MPHGNCYGKAPNLRKDPDAKDPWFPGKGDSLNTGKIKCFTCIVRVQCDEYRERTGSRHGMWGGKIVKRENDDDGQE